MIYAAGDLTIETAVFDGNSAGHKGGGFVVSTVTANVTDANFTNSIGLGGAAIAATNAGSLNLLRVNMAVSLDLFRSCLVLRERMPCVRVTVCAHR